MSILHLKKKGEPTDAGGTTLVWGVNLVEFRARMSAVAQVKEVEVRGWDPQAKAAVIGKGNPIAANADISMTPAALADKVGGKTLVVVDHPVSTQGDADILAGARADQIGSAAFEATAVVTGDSKLKAGTPVSVSGVGLLCAPTSICSPKRGLSCLSENSRIMSAISG